MSKADQIFIDNCRQILDHGYEQREGSTRPHWEDGTPAYTKKCFGLVNRYDLSDEFPILTLRPINFKAAVDELLWIWQKKSNDVRDLGSRIWDAWADAFPKVLDDLERYVGMLKLVMNGANELLGG